ncbi:MAG TPA: AsmA family protein [Burkholderiales bacterium]|nr:AsmA family protein [Burkholderiales bacterium]
MKVFKTLLLAAGGIVALIVLVIAVVAATFDPNKYKPEIAAAVQDKTGRTLAIEGNLALTFFPSVGIAVGKTSLSEPNGRGIFARFDDAKMSLALLPLFSRQVVINRVSLSGLTADLVGRKDGKTNFDDLLSAPERAAAVKHEPEPAPRREAMHLDIAGIEIRSSAIGWRDESSGSRFKASVAEFKTGRIASGVPGELALSARVEATQPKADFRIKLSGGYRLDLEKQSFALSGLNLEISDGASGAAVPAASLRGDVEVDSSPQAIRFDISVDHLNLDRSLPPPAKGGPAVAKTGPGSGTQPAAASVGRPEEPIDFSALKGLNLKGGLKIDRLVASNVKLEKVNVGMRAAGGRVEVTPLSASLYEGRLTGSASVDANTNHFSMKGQLDSVAIGPLLRDALNSDLLDGRGNVALDVKTDGATMSAMKKALSGDASLTLWDSGLKGVNLGELLRKAKSLRGSNPPAEQRATPSERTDFTELRASFVIRNGVAHNDDLSAKSPLLRLAGSGDVDIAAGSIAYLIKASVVATSGGQGGKELAELRGVTVPVKVSGPLDAPRFRADLGATVGDAVKQRAEDKLKERAQDRLKSLLRR